MRPTVRIYVRKRLKLVNDLVTPNPIKLSVHWLKVSQVRGIVTPFMYERGRVCIEYRKVTHVEMCGLARVESVVC